MDPSKSAMNRPVDAAWRALVKQLPPTTQDGARESLWWFERGWDACTSELRADAARIAKERDLGPIPVKPSPSNPYAVGDKVEFLLHRERGVCTVEALRGEKLVEVRIPNQGLMLTSVEALKPVSVLDDGFIFRRNEAQKRGEPLVFKDIGNSACYSISSDGQVLKVGDQVLPKDVPLSTPNLAVLHTWGRAVVVGGHGGIAVARAEDLRRVVEAPNPAPPSKPETLTIDVDTTEASKKLSALQQQADALSQTVDKLASAAPQLTVVKVDSLFEHVNRLQDDMLDVLKLAQRLHLEDTRPAVDMENMAEVLCYVGHCLLTLDDKRKRVSALHNYTRIREWLGRAYGQTPLPRGGVHDNEGKPSAQPFRSIDADHDTGAAPPITGEDAQP